MLSADHESLAHIKYTALFLLDKDTHIPILTNTRCVSERVGSETHQSCTAPNDSSLVMSYMRMKPMAPR